MQSSKKNSPSVLISRSYSPLIEFYTLYFWFHKAFIISLQRSKFSSFFLFLLHSGNIKKFGWLHTMIVHVAFCLWVDSRNFMAKPNSVRSLEKLSICIVWYLDMCCKVTWRSLFAFTQHCLSLIGSRAVSAFSGVMLQLFVGVLRPSPGWERQR